MQIHDQLLFEHSDIVQYSVCTGLKRGCTDVCDIVQYSVCVCVYVCAWVCVRACVVCKLIRGSLEVHF